MAKTKTQGPGSDFLWGLLIAGAVVQAFGGAIAAIMISGDGPMPALIGAWVVAGIGGSMFFVALIGFGVYHGLRAHAQESAA